MWLSLSFLIYSENNDISYSKQLNRHVPGACLWCARNFVAFPEIRVIIFIICHVEYVCKLSKLWREVTYIALVKLIIFPVSKRIGGETRRSGQLCGDCCDVFITADCQGLFAVLHLRANSSFINMNILELQEGNSLTFMDLCVRHMQLLMFPSW